MAVSKTSGPFFEHSERTDYFPVSMLLRRSAGPVNGQREPGLDKRDEKK